MDVPAIRKEPARRRGLRRAARAAALLVLAGVVVFLLGGCVSRARPPVDPPDPVTVYFLAVAMHRGVVLPRAGGGEGGGYVEYAYGEWSWYAMDRNRWHHVFSTLFWPTRGTLGRRFWEEAEVRRWAEQEGALRLRPLLVSRPKAEALRAELDARFQQGVEQAPGGALYNPTHGLSFVPHPQGYWLFHNCHDAAARWLAALGCSVSWVPVRLGLSLVER